MMPANSLLQGELEQARDRRTRYGRVITARILPEDPAASARLADHLARHGSLPAFGESSAGREAMANEVARSGLLGHGGAAFPTAAKLKAVMSQARQPVVIANGTEGEPASQKDRALLSRAPHLVLDGASVAAGVVGASEVILVVHRDVRMAVEVAVGERRRYQIDQVPLRVMTAADGFVAGEASAVVNWVARGTPVPLAKPPRLAERGLAGRPTLVQNVETLAHLALIARHGAAWYRSLGTPEEPGSMLVSLVGAVTRPGVLEVEIGTPLARVLDAAGGPTGRLQAFLVGGYFGTWLTAGPCLARPFSARGLGASLGAGLLIALPEGVCGVVESARLARYLASESAGQCGPCKFGLPAIAGELTKLADGMLPNTRDLERWLVEIEGRGACSHPDGAARQIASALQVFAEEVGEHLRGWCTAKTAGSVLAIPARVMG
jgi:NADH:ubiquinone oxidoreductase subunit F (NADH-binding)